MSVPHSSTPWKIAERQPTSIVDSEGRFIVSAIGSNEQSIATAAHIVRCVNAYADLPSDLQDLIDLAPLNAAEVRKAYLLGRNERDAE